MNYPWKEVWRRSGPSRISFFSLGIVKRILGRQIQTRHFILKNKIKCIVWGTVETGEHIFFSLWKSRSDIDHFINLMTMKWVEKGKINSATAKPHG